jgi:hypothetical protein
MKKNRPQKLDFIVDKLTNSIENTTTGDKLETKVVHLSEADLKNISPKHGWQFNWQKEYSYQNHELYKLIIPGNQNIIQGLISLEIRHLHVFMHLLESASFNKGRSKIYAGVPGNLVAFACRQSFQFGFDGYVSFFAKTQLVDHYKKTLGAIQMSDQSMVIETRAALSLIEQYFRGDII